MVVIEAALIGVFVLAFVGVVIYTVFMNHPAPTEESHGADAINDAINQFEQAQRGRSIGGWGGFASPMPPVDNVRMRRRRRRLHRSRHPNDM